MSHLDPPGAVYNAVFSSVALSTNEADLFCMTASTDSKVVVREIRLGQFTEFGDTQSELISVRMLVGSTAIGGGATITPRNVQRHPGALTAGSSVTAPSTIVASTASAVDVLADAWNVARGWFYKPDPVERLVLEPGERLALRISAPNDALTLNGTLVFQEIGN